MSVLSYGAAKYILIIFLTNLKNGIILQQAQEITLLLGVILLFSLYPYRETSKYHYRYNVIANVMEIRHVGERQTILLHHICIRNAPY